MARKHTEEEVRSRIHEKHSGRTEMVEYAGTLRGQSHFRCTECGWEWKTRAGSVAAGSGCQNCAGTRRLTLEEVRQRVETAHQGRIVLLEYSDRTNARSRFRCLACGWEWTAIFNNVARGKGCPNCAGNRKLPEEEIRVRIRDLHGGQIVLTDFGGSTSAPSQFRCSECGREWVTTLNKILAGQGCRSCSKARAGRARRIKEEEVQERISDLHKGRIELIAYGGGTNAMSSFRCTVCGWEWETKANNILQGKGCANCAGVRKLTEEEILQLIQDRHEGRVELVEYAGKTHARSSFRCLVCGWEWEARADRVGHDIGCANCAGVRKLTEDEIREAVRDRHQGRIEMVDYGGTTAARSNFRCNTCGWEWKASSQKITSGRGCARCAKTGFDPASPALLYYVRVTDPRDGRDYYKIGITNQDVEARFHQSGGRAEITTIRTWTFEIGQDAYDREQEILREYAAFNAGFGATGPLQDGNSELFTNDVLGLDGAD